MMIWEKLITSIQDRVNALTADRKKQLIIICTAVFSVILTIAVIVPLSAKMPVKERKPEEPEQITIFNIPIPADELFLPDEPDFLPGVLLDRDRREKWTENEVMEFWQDPLRDGEEQWREKIEAEVDQILESVP